MDMPAVEISETNLRPMTINGFLYFSRADKVTIHFGEDGKPQAWQLLWRKPTRTKYSSNQEEWNGQPILGQVYDDPELFNISYREITCSKCGLQKSSRDFHWKKRGYEGPFPEIWGRHDNYCKTCRSEAKSAAYKKKKTIKKRSTKPKNCKVIEISSLCVTESYAEPKNLQGNPLQFLVERLINIS